MRVLFISKGKSDLPKWIEISEIIRAKFGDRVRLLIVTGQHSYQNYPEWLEIRTCCYQGDLNTEDIEAQLLKLAVNVSPTAYRSDIRYIFSSHCETQLAAEQVFLANQAIDIFDEFKPDLIFTAGAGTMIRTVFFAVAKSFDIESFRILRGHHMNKGRKGLRYFFCDNDLGKIQENHQQLFPHEPDVVEQYAKQIILDVRLKHHKFDKYSRSMGRYWRVSKPGMGIFVDIARYLGHLLFKKDILSRKMLKYRFTCKIRSLYQDIFFTNPKKLSKRFFLFPLNVPTDAQLRLRAKEYSDTESVIRLLATNIPYGYDLVVKIHPGNPGMLETRAIRRIKAKCQNVKFLSPEISMFGFIQKSTGIFVINSNSAFEAATLGKPCIYLGSSYLAELPNCFKLTTFSDLADIMSTILAKPMNFDKGKILQVLKKYYGCTYPLITENDKKQPDDGPRQTIASAIIHLIESRL